MFNLLFHFSWMSMAISKVFRIVQLQHVLPTGDHHIQYVCLIVCTVYEDLTCIILSACYRQIKACVICQTLTSSLFRWWYLLSYLTSLQKLMTLGYESLTEVHMCLFTRLGHSRTRTEMLSPIMRPVLSITPLQRKWKHTQQSELHNCIVTQK